MTETEIKEMLNGIINNNEEWECHGYDASSGGYPLPWKPYKLGEEIHNDWEYRKVELWLVLDSDLEANKYVCMPRSEYETKRTCSKSYFTGSKEECEKWITEHSSWMCQHYGKEYWVTDDIDANKIRVSAIKNFVKELLSRVYKDAKEYDDSDDTLFTPDYVDLEDLENIIKKMGVKIE